MFEFVRGKDGKTTPAFGGSSNGCFTCDGLAGEVVVVYWDDIVEVVEDILSVSCVCVGEALISEICESTIEGLSVSVIFASYNVV